MQGHEPVLSTVRRENVRAAHLLNTWAAIACTCAAACAVVGGLQGRPLRIAWVALLGATVAWAEHHDRLFGDETSVSGSIVVVMAAIVAFSGGSWLLAPMFCASLAGLYWPHLRRAAWSRIAMNAAAMALAAAAAAGVFQFFAQPNGPFDGQTAAGGLMALGAFWAINCLILGVAVGLIRGRNLFKSCLDLLRADLELLPFAYLGLVSGYVILTRSVWAGWAGLLAILVLFDIVVVRRWRHFRWARLGGWFFAYSSTSAALVYAVTRDHLRFSAYGLVAIAMGVPAILIVERLRPSWSGLGPVAGAVATALAVPSGSTLITAIAVGLCLCVPIALRRSRAPVRVTLLAAAGLAATVAALVVEAIPFSADGHLPSALLAGAAATFAGFLAWHVVLMVDLAGEYGFRAWRTSLDLISDLVAPCAGAALIGGLAGWAAAAGGNAGFATCLFLGLVVVLALALARRLSPRKMSATCDLGNEEVLDVVQSALLDLPASRLPER